MSSMLLSMLKVLGKQERSWEVSVWKERKAVIALSLFVARRGSHYSLGIDVEVWKTRSAFWQ